MQTFPPPVPSGMPFLPPARIKVFGVLHIVFAGVGFLGALWNIVKLSFGAQFRNFAQVGSSRMVRNPAEDIQELIQKASAPYTMVTIVISVLLSVVLLVAGIALVRRRRNALRWSNGYAWSSIGLKLAGMVYCLLVLLPVINEELDKALSGAAGGSGSAAAMAPMITVMKYTLAAMFVIVPLVSCVYPVLVLAMLNKPDVRAALGFENPSDKIL